MHLSHKLYLFRETPSFIKSIDSTLDPNESYLMDIPELGRILGKDLNGGVTPNIAQRANRIADYILLCFFLGNDFMPHFPALNIRTEGIGRLMNSYNATKCNLTNGNSIVWKNLRKVVKTLSENEHAYILKEYSTRDKFGKKRNGPRNYNTRNEDDLMSVPTTDRSVEKYINPDEHGWEERYYSILFDIEINDKRRREICINYLEGLEWTMNYYTGNCMDWRWTYKYDYPPLLTDLIKYIPYFDTCLLVRKEAAPVIPLVQLSYVLPKCSLKLLPSNLYYALINEHPEWYNEDCQFRWAFCRYFWEAHAIMPDIDMNCLENFVHKKIKI